MNSIVIERVGPERLVDYSRVSIAFEVRSVLEVEAVDGGLGGLAMTERPVNPYMKDYDIAEYHPVNWPQHWDVQKWAFFVAFDGETPVGGATVSIATPGLYMNADFPGSANLWDLRVGPEWRGKGLGRLLVGQAAAFAVEAGYRKMHVETQNVNVPACRFYRAMGFMLFGMDTRAYADLPHETMLLWRRDLPTP